MTPLDDTSLRKKAVAAGQGHVFRFFDELDEADRAVFLTQLRAVDFEEIDRLYRTLVADGAAAREFDPTGLAPAPYEPLPEHGGDPAVWAEAREIGEAKIREGKVAAFTVAGGQGTRLGFNGPKGTFPVTPVQGRTLFEVFGGKIAAASRDYGVRIPWLVMTSPVNHAATETFFREKDWFGLGEEDVLLFQQGTMPAIDFDGKLLLAEKGSLALSPDGHGGSLRALVRSGAVTFLQERGIEALSYFQVDNPLVKFIDPCFFGFHFRAGSELSSKMIPKAYPEEKVGHFCVLDGKTQVVEYSDFPEDLTLQTDPDGQLTFRAGSVAIHVFDVAFIERMGTANFPMHRADKKVPHLDESGNLVEPETANGVKFEMFVFDALVEAVNPVIIEARREDEFSPVKNAEGRDSPQSCCEDQLREWARWAEAAGIGLETDPTGLPSILFEVEPSYGYDCDSFVRRARKDGLTSIAPGQVLL